jgi:organic hydroperoxide reductase OsmC/OhrA
MSEHCATISWQRGDTAFDYDSYSRDHSWEFVGGTRVEASAAPDFLGSPDGVDPEEAFVAAVSSCHMLTFLALAARRRRTVNGYRDCAIGSLEENVDGRLAITRVILRPEIQFDDSVEIGDDEIERLHHLAHEHCFIANSIRTEVRVEAPLPGALEP